MCCGPHAIAHGVGSYGGMDVLGFVGASLLAMAVGGLQGGGFGDAIT